MRTFDVTARTREFFKANWALICVLLFSVGMGSANHFGLNVPLINDEALELSQGVALPLNRFYFFAPPEIYPQAEVDRVETFLPYLNSAIAKFGWSRNVDEGYVRAIRIVFLVAFVIGVVTFAAGVRRQLGNRWALLSGLLLSTSAFVLIGNHTLTRNGVSLMWAGLVIWIIARWFGSERADAARPVWRFAPAILLGLVLVAGCWTYTSFRMITLAVFAALALDWYRFDRTANGARKILLAGGVFGAVLVLLLLWDGSPWTSFLKRGNYAMGTGETYLRRLALSLVSPWHYVENADASFLVEDVHIMMHRAFLNVCLAPFFVLGAYVAWVRPERLLRFAVVCWLVGMLLCAVAGPNVKYLFVFSPLVLLVCVYGIREFARILAARHLAIPVVAVAAVIFGFGIIAAEMRDLFVRFPAEERHRMNAVPVALVKAANRAVQRGASKVFIQPGLGYDVVTWQLSLLPPPVQRVIQNCYNVPLLRQAMTTPPPPTRSVLVIDFPARQIPERAEGWVPPPEVEVLFVER